MVITVGELSFTKKIRKFLCSTLVLLMAMKMKSYDQVREGTQALCIGQSFSQMTQDAFTCITKLMNGETLESDVVWTEPDIVNAETIDNFPYPEW